MLGFADRKVLVNQCWMRGCVPPQETQAGTTAPVVGSAMPEGGTDGSREEDGQGCDGQGEGAL